jgi:hypothetical protein
MVDHWLLCGHRVSREWACDSGASVCSLTMTREYRCCFQACTHVEQTIISD